VVGRLSAALAVDLLPAGEYVMVAQHSLVLAFGQDALTCGTLEVSELSIRAVLFAREDLARLLLA